MSEKWTPGPYEVRKAGRMADGAYDYAIGAHVGDRKHCIAEVFGRVSELHTQDAEATANLFAAAPAMAEALEALIDDYSYATPAGTENCRYCDLNMDAEGTGRNMHEPDCKILIARAALASAHGKTDAAS